MIELDIQSSLTTDVIRYLPQLLDRMWYITCCMGSGICLKSSSKLSNSGAVAVIIIPSYCMLMIYTDCI